VMSSGQQDEYIDCRPSDGIALALRSDIPIFVEESVLASSSQKSTELPDMVDLLTFLHK